MRLMMGVVALMIVSVLSIAVFAPSGEAQTGSSGLEASVDQPPVK